jgi:hypothetical protein
MMNEMSRILRICGLAIAVLGIAWYTVAILLWILGFYVVFKDARSLADVEWFRFVPALAAPLLLGLSIAAIKYRNKPRRFTVVLAAGLVIAGVWSRYDYVHNNYQLGTHSVELSSEDYQVLGKGYHQKYVNWPWLNR